MNNNSQIKTENNNEEKEIVPDQLNITIRTSIPGYQSIEYKPSMTIKDSDAKGVQFDPLLRLNKSKIDTIPTEYRIKQFFNKGLFQSLKNYNGGTPAKSLLQATRNGTVDNNIKVTLDTIFPVNSVIYIGNKPYAIGDTQWTSGDWKIDVKQKKVEIDPNKITDPQLYTQLVREEIISGEEQLSKLPKSLITGNNYSGPPVNVASGPPINLASGVKDEQQIIKKTTPESVPSTTQLQSTTSLTYKKPLKTIQLPTSTEIVPAKPTPEKAQPAIEYSQPRNQITSVPTKPLALPPVNESQQIEELSPEEERLYESIKDKFQINSADSSEFSKYFSQNIYYSIANSIYLYLSKERKNAITNFYKLVTQPKIIKEGKNLSRTMYDTLCKQAKILKSPSDGNCFFSAVADGINIYNYSNQDSKVIYQNYGKTQLFSIQILREIVLRYYYSLDEAEKNDLIIIGNANVEYLNEEFKKSLQEFPVETNEGYMERLNEIYKINENFFVYKPDSRPIYIDEEFTPFKLVSNQQIESYIKSNNYWGDQFAIQAVCKILNISIIPIEKKGSNKNVRLFARISEANKDVNTCSNNVLFLYKKNLHYQLIRFEYLEQKIEKKM